jgi:hypothetical protein
MPHFRKRLMIAWSLPCLIMLGGCDDRPKPECDSFETRSAVLQTVSSDHGNHLVKFAAGHSAEANSTDKDSAAEKPGQQPLYLLGDKMVTRSTSDNKRTLKCSGAISVTVGETKASKEVNFTVQQESDGKTTVSVEPFQFCARRPASLRIPAAKSRLGLRRTCR